MAVSYHDTLQLLWARNRARRDAALGQDWLVFIEPSSYKPGGVFFKEIKGLLKRLADAGLIAPASEISPTTDIWWGEGTVLRRLTEAGRVVLADAALGG